MIKKIFYLIFVIFKWSITYLTYKYKYKDTPINILFCMVDHFEPGRQKATLEVEKKNINDCIKKYPKLANKHKDFYGNIPKRTWFFLPYHHRYGNLKKLVQLCQEGYGEIELHLHHGKTQPDTAENLEKTIKQCLIDFGEFGIFGAENGEKRYGFIHGDWALDNSLNNQYCGVNNEISILKKTGCYADFTFPGPIDATPRQINSIFYATDNPEKPKSYNTGTPVHVGGKVAGDLMIIQGPKHPFFFNNKITGLRAPGDDICGDPRVDSKRIDSWINTGIHIKGKNNWVIVKTHTHGAAFGKAVYGEEMDSIFNYLESKYNDGTKYILHYVTARELYNIIKAIEAGEKGSNPEEYKDYIIKKPSYDSSPEIMSSSVYLKELIEKTFRG